MPGPIVLSAVGDSYALPVRVTGIVWEGATTAGDRVEVRDRVTNALLLALRASDTNTLSGVTWPAPGLNCPNGFKLALAPSGQMIQVFIAE